MVSTHEKRFYSVSDAEAAIGNLLPVDILYLRKAAIAAKFTHRTNYTEDDLINESICRTLSGDRNWNKNLNIVNHLIGVIRSISNDIRRKKNNNTEISAVDLSDKEKEKLTPKHTSTDPSESYEVNGNIAIIIAEIKPDKLASKIIKLLFEEQERKDIVKILNISTKQYDTKKKYITRKIKKLIEREKCDE